MHPVDDTVYPTRQLRRATLREQARARFFRTNPWVKAPEGFRPLDRAEPRVYPLTLPRVQRRKMLRFLAAHEASMAESGA